MSEWRPALLGDLFERSNEKLGPHEREPKILTLSKYNGFVPAEDYFGKRIASAQLDGYKTVQPGGWAYSSIHIDEGSIARNDLGYGGVISPMYTTMCWTSDEVDDPRYVGVLLTMPSMLSIYRSLAQGTVNRRRTLAWTAFASISVTLPPLDVQRRIVDLVCALDANIAALEAGAAAASHLINAVGNGMWHDETVVRRAIASLGAVVTGSTPSTSSIAYWESPDVGFITPGDLKGGLVRTVVRQVSSLGASVGRKVPKGAVSVCCIGARRAVGITQQDSVTNQQINSVLVSTPEDAWCLLGTLVCGEGLRALEGVTGQTAVPMIAKGTFSRIQVPWPDLAVRILKGQLLASLDETRFQAMTEAAALRNVRSALLPALLSGDIEIPESYDELVGAL